MELPKAHNTREICDDCIDIFKDAAILLSSMSREESTATITADYQIRMKARVSLSRCHMCVLIAHNISDLFWPLISTERTELVIYKANDDEDAVTLNVRVHYTEKNVFQGHRRGEIRIQNVNHGIVHVLNSPKTWSFETLKTIRSWIKTCNLYHISCKISRIGRRLPLRLIDVMSSNTDSTQTKKDIGHEEYNQLMLEELSNVRIYPSKNIPPDSSYLTLSHRWSRRPSILLTKNSSFLLNGDISPYLLEPKDAAVFQHAIRVTRCLGFRYLWIDALCIMQDDEMEKMSEIMYMDEIYFNSALNISATEGTTDGLFFDRNNFYVNPCRTVVKTPETQQEVELQAFSERCFLQPSEGPLNKRGWVFQERTLAPRIIHFTKDQVFWECHSLEASEVLPQGFPALRVMPFKKHILRSSHVFTSQQVKQQWYELVDNYSETSLTFADDRLLAISAVAKRWCSVMGLDASDYLAGMWKADLPLSLLWSQKTQLDVRAFQSPSIINETEMKFAPSWSWASILAGIDCADFSDLVAATKVLDIWIHRRSQNFFDGADFCRLRLRGPVCKVSRQILDGKTWLYIRNEGEDTVFEELQTELFQENKSLIILWDRNRQSVAGFLKNNSEATSSTYFLLQIASEDDINGLIIRGVVLRRTDRSGTFSRVGYFLTSSFGEYQNTDLENAFNGRLYTLDTEDYLEVDSNGKYTIDIF